MIHFAIRGKYNWNDKSETADFKSMKTFFDEQWIILLSVDFMMFHGPGDACYLYRCRTRVAENKNTNLPKIASEGIQ